MAIIPESLYPGQITPANSQYPYGKARNITTPGDGTGTPFEENLVNDLFGFQQALLSAGGVVPTGTPDYVGNSQYLTAIQNVISSSITGSEGFDWSIRTSAADNGWYSVIYGNGLFVAVAISGTGDRVMTSPDGVNWTSQISAADNDWRSVTYGNGLFVAIASSGTGDRVMTSPDGINWTSRTSAADLIWRSVTYGNGLFVAVASDGTGNRVMTSPDGINWTSRTSAADNEWYSVTYGNGLFVAVAMSGTGDRVMTSPDGINWTLRTSAADNVWRSVTYGNGLFVAVSSNGTGDRVMTSPDGINWASRTSAADNRWHSVTYGNGLFVAVSYNGTGDRVMTSPDGINWTLRTSAADNGWYGLAYGNGLFVAVSNNGISDRVMTSGKQKLQVLRHDNKLNGGLNVTGDILFDNASFTSSAIGFGTTTPNELVEMYSDSVPNLLIRGDVGTIGTKFSGVQAKWDATVVAEINFESWIDAVNKDDGVIVMRTADSGTLYDAMYLRAGAVGFGTDPASGSRMHVKQGSSGATADAGADDFIFEINGNGGISILNSDTGISQIALGSASDSYGAFFKWQYSTSACQLGTSKTGATIEIQAGNASDAIKVDDDSTAGNTRFFLYDVDNGTLARVTVGIADSGGAGYKVLRIPN